MERVRNMVIGALPAMVEECFTTLDDLWVTTESPLALSFDTSRMYLFRGVTDFYLPLNVLTSSEVLRCLLWMIESRSMGENIRTSENKILFRSFKGDVTLDVADNEIRNILWSIVADKVGLLPVWSFLMNKYVSNLASASVTLYRTRSTLKHFERLTSRSSPSVRTQLQGFPTETARCR